MGSTSKKKIKMADGYPESIVSIRITPEIKRKLKIHCVTEGIEMQTFVRDAILAKLPK